MIFPIRRHRIVDIYNKELRDNIRAVVKPYKWLAINIVRIGYSSKVKENPVVILTIVEEGKMRREEG
jgi:hypothetical protein